MEAAEYKHHRKRVHLGPAPRTGIGPPAEPALVDLRLGALLGRDQPQRRDRAVELAGLG